MLYMILGRDTEGSLAQRRQARPAHLERLQHLQNQGRLLVAGPLPVADTGTITEAGVSGSLVVAEFDSLQQARQWAEQDPYVSAGVYREIEVRPFIASLPS
jgi:uncharacterized protein YciI